MSGRVYSAPINIGATTTQIDIVEIKAAAEKPIELLGFQLGQTSEVGDAQEEQLTLVLKRVTSDATGGTGGTAATPVPRLPNDTAAGAAVQVGNTTKRTGGTTNVTLKRFAWNVRGEEPYVPIPETWVRVGAAGYLVLELATTPADAIGGIVGYVDFAELV